MTQILTIAQLGNPILRQIAQPINQINDRKIQNLIDDLIATMTPANGVGIAAPQVSESQRIIIVASRPTLRYPSAPLMEPTPMINPQIIDHSAEIVKGWEGCLSIPGIRGLVPRYEAIEVEYIDQSGECQKQELTGFVARIFQHEFDHLEGMLFIDRVENTRDLMTEDEYQKQIVKQL
jgi:peptide deformylase